MIYGCCTSFHFKIYKYNIISIIYIINYTIITLPKCIYYTVINKFIIKIIFISFVIKYYFITIICTFILFILLRCSSINKNTKLGRTASNT